MKNRSSKFKIQNSNKVQFRIPHSAFRNSSGFSYIALLVAIVIIGISLGAAGKYWQYVMFRDKEEELIFRGDQYRQAIERYYFAIPGRPQYPQNIDDLLTDNRTPAGKRHLRQRYKDPMTGEDFEIITSQTLTPGVPAAGAVRPPTVPGIIGVVSTSDKEPLKKDNFPPIHEDFAGKSAYSEWRFIANTKTVLTPTAVMPRVPGLSPAAVSPLGAVRR